MTDPTECDSESAYEEEEAIILIELNGVIDSDLLAQNSFERFKLIGIESDNPILQLNNYVFSGEYTETMGTALIFEEDEKKYKKCDPIFCQSPTNRLKYVCNTFKVLNMKRVFIAEKNEVSNESQESAMHEETAATSAIYVDTTATSEILSTDLQ